MLRATLGKLVKPRQRRSPCGPSRVRWSDGERLQDMRRRLASTENQDTLRRIGVDVAELAMTAPENLLGDISELVDRVHAKTEHLAPPKAPRKPRKQRPPTAKMDEAEPSVFSVKTDLLLARLREVHGSSRADIPPGLLPP
jgi:hypothetical protein